MSGDAERCHCDFWDTDPEMGVYTPGYYGCDNCPVCKPLRDAYREGRADDFECYMEAAVRNEREDIQKKHLTTARANDPDSDFLK